MAETTPKAKRIQRPRKTSQAPNRTGNKPAISNRLKELWQDPVWRERTLANIRAAAVRRRGKPGRFGVPDGMRKAEAEKVRAAVKESVQKTMSELQKAGFLDESTDEAKEALGAALEVMRMPQDQKLKLAAARLVLDFTKSKPASKSIVAIDEAEQWLSQIAGDDGEQGEASTDA